MVKASEMDPIERANTSHKKTPIQKAEYIIREMELTSRVRHILMTCGKKEKVVSVPATSPKHSNNDSILCFPFAKLL